MYTSHNSSKYFRYLEIVCNEVPGVKLLRTFCVVTPVPLFDSGSQQKTQTCCNCFSEVYVACLAIVAVGSFSPSHDAKVVPSQKGG